MIEVFCWLICVLVGLVAGYYARHREACDDTAAEKYLHSKELALVDAAWQQRLADTEARCKASMESALAALRELARRNEIERNERQGALQEINEISGAFLSLCQEPK